MRKVSVRDARRQLRVLLDVVRGGEEVAVLRRGVEVARLVPAPRPFVPLPDLSELRASVRLRGRRMSADVIASRRSARY
jgi:prevent-host-death family protein